MTVLTDIHLCKRASVAHTDHIHSKVSEEIDDLQRFAAQAEDKNEGCDDGTQQLLQYKHLKHRMKEDVRCDVNVCGTEKGFSSVTYSLVLKELSELVSGLVAVGVTLPVIRHVVDVCQNDFKQLLGTERHMLVWDKRPGAD